MGFKGLPRKLELSDDSQVPIPSLFSHVCAALHGQQRTWHIQMALHSKFLGT